MLNIGVVRAFGKQDLTGAASIWQQVVDIAPESAEGRAAKRMIEAVRSAHPEAARPGRRRARRQAAGERRLMIRWVLNIIVLLLLLRLALRFVLGLLQGPRRAVGGAASSGRAPPAGRPGSPASWSRIRCARPTSRATSAIAARVAGETRYYCSETCRDKDAGAGHVQPHIGRAAHG